MSLLTVSAPGKIHLLGEHSVVYGHPALLSAIDKRTYVSVKPSKDLEIFAEEKDYLFDIIKIFEKKFEKTVSHIKITVRSQIPIGRHAGSSAALAVAAFGALTRYFLKLWDPPKINELAYEAEKIKHGNPSGADNSICCFGGLLWYRKEVEFLKSIWSLPVSAYKMPQFVLIDTGAPLETTFQMVEKVNFLYKKRARYLNDIFSDQEKQTKRLLIALKDGNTKDMVKAITTGERNLEKMGVVSLSSQKLIKQIEKTSGVGKICGGGGHRGPTGFILTYHKNPKILIDIAQRMKLPAFYAKLGAEGIRVEQN